MPSNLLVAFGDTHTSSVTGLAPPKTQIDTGGYYHANAFQMYLWGIWYDMWAQIEHKAQVLGCDVTAVCLGDSVDKNKYSKNGVFAHNPNSMLRAAHEVMEPVLDVSKRFYLLRRTPAHEGEESWLAEALAERIGAVKSAKHSWSWWHLPLEVSGVQFDIKHHPESGDMRWWTAGGGMIRSAASVIFDYVDSGHKPPDIVLRGHRHQWRDSGTNLPTRAFTVPAWQGPTDFVHRIGAGGSKIPKFGCAWFYCEDGSYEWGRIMYQPERPAMEKVE